MGKQHSQPQRHAERPGRSGGRAASAAAPGRAGGGDGWLLVPHVADQPRPQPEADLLRLLAKLAARHLHAQGSAATDEPADGTGGEA